jgi:hypothetical protein
MRRRLLDLHLYLGLLCLPYVVVFGVSSILLNHRIRYETKSEWQAQVAPLGAERPIVEADRVWYALDRSGRVQSWTVEMGDTAGLRFQATRPGRGYQVVASSDGHVSVVESDYGVLGTLRDLHGLSDRYNSFWVLGWSVYTELTAVTLVASLVSGTILMLRRGDGRSRGLWAGGVIAAAAALIAGIW